MNVKDRLWPTPTATDNEHPNCIVNERGRRIANSGGESHSLGLADAVRILEDSEGEKLRRLGVQRGFRKGRDTDKEGRCEGGTDT